MSSPISKIADDLANNQPEVQPHAIAAEEAKESARKAEWAELRDADGMSFDPSIHVTESDGSPKVTTSGRLRKRPGRKTGSSHGSLHKPDATASKQDSDQRANATAAATATVDSVGMLGRMIGNEEWKFVKDDKQGIDERAAGIDAFTEYYVARGITDVPPGVMVLMWFMSYAGQRVMYGQQTQSKIGRLKAWIGSKILKRRAAKKEADNDATQ